MARFRTLLSAALIASIATAAFFIPQPRPNTVGVCPPTCNVILISIDSLRYDHLGFSHLNTGESVSPFMDAFGEENIVFENFISASFLTPISEMAVHTGMMPLANGVTRFDATLDDSVLTLAQLLKAEGYHTAAMGSSPEFYYYDRGLTDSFARGFDEYYEAYFHHEISNGFSAQRRVPTEALSWLARPPQGKFFLWVTLGTVHWPWGGPEYAAQVGYAGWMKNEGSTWGSHFRQVYKGTVWDLENPGTPLFAFTTKDDAYVNSAYDQGVADTDAFLGELFAQIKARGMWDNTIIIVQSEHGEDLGEHGYYAHYDIFDTTVHVPLLVRVPGITPMRITQPASAIDVLPTLFDFLRIYTPPKATGYSFGPIIRGEKPEGDAPVFTMRIPYWNNVVYSHLETDERYEILHPDIVEKVTRMDEIDRETPLYDVAIRTHDWKLIWRRGLSYQRAYDWWAITTLLPYEGSEFELYNLKEDPREQRNVYHEHPDIASGLKEKLLSWHESEVARAGERDIGERSFQPYF